MKTTLWMIIFMLAIIRTGFAQQLTALTAEDVYIDESFPDSNFYGQGLTLSILNAGPLEFHTNICLKFYFPENIVSISDAKCLLTIDTSLFPNDVIDQVDIYLLTGPWSDDNLTWASAQPLIGSFLGSVTPVSGNLYLDIPFPIVNDWLNNPGNNFGIMLVAESALPLQSGYFFDSKSPDVFNSPQLRIICQMDGIPPPPQSIEGPDTVCDGEMAEFEIFPPSGGFYYNWYSPPGWGIIFPFPNSFVTIEVGTTSGVVCATISNMYGTSALKCKNVIVEPPLQDPGTIIGNSNPCIGDTVEYTFSNIVPGYHYHWQVPDDWVVISGLDSTNLTVVVTSHDLLIIRTVGYCPVTPYSSDYISAEPAPTVLFLNGPASVLSNSLVSYTAIADYPDYYIWTLPPGATVYSGDSTNQVQIWFGSLPGTLCVSGVNNCGTGVPKCVNVSMIYEGIEENESAWVTLTTLPGVISVANKTPKKVTVNVYDLTGATITCGYSLANMSDLKINLKQGFYLVNCQSGSKSKTFKVCVVE